jgi:hypothetical protein
VVLVEVVLWVCADIEATAKPKNAMIASDTNDVFIDNKGFRLNLLRADTKESRRVTNADVALDGVTAKVISFYKYVDR